MTYRTILRHLTHGTAKRGRTAATHLECLKEDVGLDVLKVSYGSPGEEYVKPQMFDPTSRIV